MTSGAVQSVKALRRSHDDLVNIVAGLDLDGLARQSAASEWSVAQVLSHLGSAAEIGLNTLTTGQADMAAAQGIWDRWNAMSATEQATNFVSAGESLVQGYEGLDDTELATRKVDVGFLPEPVDIEFLAGMRLTEVGLHRWDIEVGLDPTVGVVDYLVPIILARIPLFAGFFAKPIGRSGRIAIDTTDPTRKYVLEIDESGATLGEGPGPDSANSMTLPAESLIRLTTGRLGPRHTPAEVFVKGDVSLEDLRRVFPGF